MREGIGRRVEGERSGWYEQRRECLVNLHGFERLRYAIMLYQDQRRKTRRDRQVGLGEGKGIISKYHVVPASAAESTSLPLYRN